MKKAVFFDVDGTILDSKVGKTTMNPEVEKAIRKLQAAGHYVFVATGRPYAFISPYLHNFGFDGFLLCNGAQIIMNHETVFKASMDKQFVKQVMQLFDKHQVEYILESSHESYIKAQYQNLKDLYVGLGVSEKMLSYMENPNMLDELDIFKIEILCKTTEVKEQCINFLKDYPGYEYFFSIGHELFEIHDKRRTKGTGILKVLEILNIPVEDSFAFGDGTNDIDMLQTVGCGIAMGNSIDEVKAAADYVTDKVSEDGVAKGIEKYILS